MADLAFVLITLIWGATFVTIKDAVTIVTPVRFLALRFGLAALVLLLVAARDPATRRALARPGAWRDGATAGVALFAGYLTQTLGLVWTTPAVSAFLTGTSVVLVPVLAVTFLRRRVSGGAWTGAGLAFAGVAALSLRGDLTMGPGEALTVGTALAFATQVLVLERIAPRWPAVTLAAIQLAVTAALAGAALPLDGWLAARSPLLPAAGGPFDPLPARAWLEIVGMALFASALAFALQAWAQKRIPATRAGVLLTLEPLFALLFGVVVFGERLDARARAGMGLILAGMLVVETLGRRGESQPPAPGPAADDGASGVSR